jgi:hypothetical protein
MHTEANKMSIEHAPARQRVRPRFGKVATALSYAEVSRSRLYEWGRKQPKLFRKNGSASMIDFDVLDAILDELPVANLKTDD